MRKTRTLAIFLLFVIWLFTASCGEGNEGASPRELRPDVPVIATWQWTPRLTPTPTPTSTPSPTPEVIPSPTLSVTPEPMPEEAPQPDGVEESEGVVVIPVAEEPVVEVIEPPAEPTLEPTPEPTPEIVATPQVDPTPEPTTAPEPSEELLGLLASLELTAANYPDWTTSFCVTDLQNGEAVCRNGDVQRYTGCVIDLFALLAAVKQFEAGESWPDDYISVQIRAGIGSSSPINAANFLAAAYGGSLEEGMWVARQIVQELGLTGTTFGSVPLRPIEPNPPANVSTAWDTNLALTRLWNGEIFDQRWTNYTITVMTESEYTETMPSLVQWKGATVAHKIGYFGYESGYYASVWNDVGIVFWEKDGKRVAFALSVYTEGPWAGKVIVAELADAAFDYFDAKY